MPKNSRAGADSIWRVVAIGITKDGRISPTHFGDADRMMLGRVRSGEYEVIDNIPSPLATMEETHGRQKKLMYAARFLKDVQIIATAKPSINFKKLRIEKGKWPIVTAMEPEVFLAWLSENLDEVTRWYDNPDNHVFRTP